MMKPVSLMSSVTIITYLIIYIQCFNFNLKTVCLFYLLPFIRYMYYLITYKMQWSKANAYMLQLYTIRKDNHFKLKSITNILTDWLRTCDMQQVKLFYVCLLGVKDYSLNN